MTTTCVASVSDAVSDGLRSVSDATDPLLAAAHLVYALDQLGVTVVREPLDPARATRGELPALHLRAASPRILAAIPPALRAQLEQFRPALAEILEPSLLMTATLNRGAALVARHDPAWTTPGGIAFCEVCGRPTVLAWASPAGQRLPLHPACVDPRAPGATLPPPAPPPPVPPAPDPLAFLGDFA